MNFFIHKGSLIIIDNRYETDIYELDDKDILSKLNEKYKFVNVTEVYEENLYQYIKKHDSIEKQLDFFSDVEYKLNITKEYKLVPRIEEYFSAIDTHTYLECKNLCDTYKKISFHISSDRIITVEFSNKVNRKSEYAPVVFFKIVMGQGSIKNNLTNIVRSNKNGDIT